MTATSAITIESQPSDARGLSSPDRDALIVSIARLGDEWAIVSRYGDPRWTLRSSRTNAGAYDSVLRFDRVPREFREVVKAAMYRYLRRGRSQGVRPTVSTMGVALSRTVAFVSFLVRLKVSSLAGATQAVCKMYVDAAQAEIGSRGKRRKAATLDGLFHAVEALYELSQYTDDPMPGHPWPGTSAALLAGHQTSKGRLRAGRTPIIPDAAFVLLFQASWTLLQQAEHLLDLRDATLEVERELQHMTETPVFVAKNRCLERLGWIGGIAGLRNSLTQLRTACYIVIASLSGCRNHELAFLETGACYQTKDDDGETYWWMRSISTKTGAGATEWMIPEAAVRAISIMERWALPYQQRLADEIERRRGSGSLDLESAEADRHACALFVGLGLVSGHVRTLSNSAWRALLRQFATEHNIDWMPATHHFRRTFANYAARSRFGDLRYLKEHFKHWSMDMTLGYALNESQELALYQEIYDELDEIKGVVVEGWLSPSSALAGGYGAQLARWRGGEEIKLFKDRASMVRAIAESTAIRANGFAWCTADDDVCVANGALERTKCSTCNEAVIGEGHSEVYQQMYEQLEELSSCTDIGPGGQARVARDLDRCGRVLLSLGCAPKESS